MKHDHKFRSNDADGAALEQQLTVGWRYFSAPNDLDAGFSTNKKQVRRTIGLALLLFDIVSITASFSVADIFRHGILTYQQSLLLMVILPIFAMITLSKDGYSARATIDFKFGIRTALAGFLMAAGSVLLFAFALKTTEEFSRIMFGSAILLTIATLTLSRHYVTKIGRNKLGHNPYSTLLIDENDPATMAFCPKESMSPVPWDYNALLALGEIARDMERVVVKCAPENREKWAFAMKSLNIHGEIIVEELTELAPLALTLIAGKPALLLSCDPLSLRQRLSKRILDLVIVALALPIALPILLIAAAAIKLESGGPAFFLQKRIGLANRNFTIWKLRSMHINGDGADGSVSTHRDDGRLTRVGSFLRSTSIDELPQLFNVLIGDMSIVGPRPHAAGSKADNRLFWDIDGRYWHRNAVKPGLTGLAQVRGFRGATHAKADLVNRLQADLEYLSNWSFWKDLEIILKTFSVVIHKNAY
ncbi:exopolysaccharide biosynthesis polyprenyl glycosylphosphotransferase [Parasphingorhabdus sp.]|uniref:exopolysaccharide biosynthesis polyprenyl glycosylphosphotransferase n=1 Tax=Parasphingorhabdus sp. TaxID=2709688 RepID=UPI003002D87C